MVSPTIGLGGYRAPEVTRGRSASQILEELRRRQRYQLASAGATEAERLTEERVVPRPLPQSTKPLNAFEIIRGSSSLGPERLKDVRWGMWPKEADPRLPAYQGNFLEKSEDFFKDLFQGPKQLRIHTVDERTGAEKWFPGMSQEERQEFFRGGNALLTPLKVALNAWQQTDAATSLGLGALLHSNPVTGYLANSPALGWKYGKDEWYGDLKTPYSDKAIADAQKVISEHVAQLGGQLVGAPTQDLGGSLIERLTAIHKKESGLTQFVQELTSPSSIATWGIGIPAGAKALSPRKQALQSIREGLVDRGEIATIGQIAKTPAIKDLAYELLISPKNQEWLSRTTWVTLPGTNLQVPSVVNRSAHFAMKHLNPNGIADPEDPAHLIMLASGLKDDLIGDAVALTAAQFLKHGDPIALFQLNERMESTLIKNLDGSDAHFFEIAGQRGRRYGDQLTPAQMKWLENTDNQFKAMREYLVESGVKNPEFADIALKDADYFPQLWSMLDDIRLRGAKSSMGRTRILGGGKQWWENSRTYTDTADALKEGFWTDYGDPMQAVHSLLRSMYSSAYDHDLVKLLKPYGKTMAERFNPKYAKAQRFANGQVTALREIGQFIGKVRNAKGPATLVTRRMLRGELVNLPPLVQNVLKVATQNTYSLTRNAKGNYFVSRPDGTLVATSRRGFRNEDTAWQAAANDLFKSVKDQEPWVPPELRSIMDQITNRQEISSKWRGRKVSYSYAGDLARRADEASLLTGKERSAAFNALQTELTKARSDANLMKSSVDRAVKRSGEAKGYLGEVQFPGSALSGRIFTPEEVAERVFKERQIADPDMFAQMRFLDADQIKDITTAIRGYQDNLTWSTLWGIPKVASKISSAMRTVQAGLDFGVMVIHGLPLLLTNPEGWGRAVAPSFGAMTDRTVMARYITDHWDTVQALARHNQLGGAGSEYIEGLQKSGLLNKFLEGITTVGERTGTLGTPVRLLGETAQEGVRRIETQFDAFLLAGKVEMWEGLEPSFRAAMAAQGLSGANFPEAELAEHVAKMTGTLNMNNLGVSPTLQQVAGGFLMFAPKYRMATYGVMVDAFRGNIRGELARQSLSRMAAGGMSMYLAMGLALKQEPNLNPTKSEFLTYEIGGQEIGIGSAWVSTVRFLANATSQAITDPDQLIRVDSRDSKLNRFMSGQMAPTTRIGKYMIEGKNYFGEPTMDSPGSFLQNVVADGGLPFWASGLMDTPKGGWAGLIGVLPEVGGLRSFPKSTWDHAQYLANVRALEQGDVPYDDMSGREQMIFRQNNPDIDQLIEEATLGFVGRGTEESIRRQEYFSGIRKYKDEQYKPQLDDLVSLLAEHLRYFDDADAYNDFISEQSTDYKGHNLQEVSGVRGAIAHLGRDLGDFYNDFQAEYPDVLLSLEELRKDKVDSAPLEDVAYYDYLAEVVLREFPILNTAGEVIGYDFSARRDANDRFKAKWGEAMYQLVRDRRWMSKDASPLLMELELGKEKHESFFRIDELLMGKDEFGFATNLELKAEWPTYQRIKGDSMLVAETYIGRESLLGLLKQFDSGVSAARKLYRERNQVFDAWYYKWDYSKTMVHPENTDIWAAKGDALSFR